MTSPVKTNSLPTLQSTLQSPQKHNSSPTVVRTGVLAHFELLREKLFKTCSDNYGTGEVGQPAIDRAWETLCEYVREHQQFEDLLPKTKPINAKVSREGRAYIESIQKGW